MPGQDFVFAVELSAQRAPIALLDDLASHVLRHVGCARDAAHGLSGAVEQAMTGPGAVGDRRCDVQFRAQHGVLEVLVSSNGGRVWQTRIPIP